MQRDTGLAQAVAAVLEALFHRDTDADELGPGLPHDVAQAAHGLTARHEVIDDEDLVRGTEPLLGDEQRDLLLIGIGKNIALIEAALDVVTLGLLGEHHRHAEGLRADRGQGDAAGFGRQHKGDVLAGKHAPEFLRDLLHQWHVDAMIQETIHLHNVSGQDLAFLPDPFLQKLHGNLPPFSIVDAYIMPEKRGKSNRKNRLREKNRNGPAACLQSAQIADESAYVRSGDPCTTRRTRGKCSGGQ